MKRREEGGKKYNLLLDPVFFINQWIPISVKNRYLNITISLDFHSYVYKKTNKPSLSQKPVTSTKEAIMACVSSTACMKLIIIFNYICGLL